MLPTETNVNLADGDQRYTLVLGITRDALSAWIEYPLAIHVQLIAVVSMMQGQLNCPGAVRLTIHGLGDPLIKIANNAYRFCLGGKNRKIGGTDYLFSRIPIPTANCVRLK